jgi:NADPH:quinone reductase-like Zn-dependent oxidoreductase
MKAIVYYRYGAADVLQCADIEKPAPQDHEVLIKVRAAALNPLDWRMLKGVPSIFRAMMKIRKPSAAQPLGIGRDVAGVVQAIGREVRQFQVGDEVFGLCEASVAEYCCAKESAVVKKPEAINFEQAASIPVAGLTALQGLRNKGEVRPSQLVLINGAAGGVGTFAVQLAKSFGAEVTGVCGPANVEMVRSIGADSVIDYTQQDFTKLGKCYDLILECVGNKSFAECRPVLNRNGRFVFIGAPHDVSMITIVSSLMKAMASSLFASQKAITFIAKSNQPDLALIGDLIATGKITPVIDRQYPLDQTPEAIHYLEAGHARGKVVVSVENSLRRDASEAKEI